MSADRIAGKMVAVVLEGATDEAVIDIRGLLQPELPLFMLAAQVLSPRTARVENLTAAFSAAWKDRVKFKIHQGDQISSMNFKYVDFWVRIQDVPFGWATKEMGSVLVQALGRVKDVVCDGFLMKVRVKIDITCPLKKGLCGNMGNQIWTMATYSNLGER